MKHCTTDDEGRPTAFYCDEVHRTIPADAFEISDEDWLEYLENPACRRFEDGVLVECDPPYSVEVD